MDGMQMQIEEDEMVLSEIKNVSPVFVLVAKSDQNDERLWLPLTTHLVDTAMVMDYLINKWLPVNFCDNLGLSKSDFFKLAKSAAMFHDVGKSTKLFQQRITERRPELSERLLEYGLDVNFKKDEKFLNATIPHSFAGAEILRKKGFGESLAAVVGAHHGKAEPNSDPICETYPKSFGWDKGGNQNTEWGVVQRELIGWAMEQSGLDSSKDLPECTMMAQFIISSLVITADWIASNTHFFPLIPIDELQLEYDPERARTALKKLRFPKPWMVSDDWRTADYFSRRFGFEANSIQTCMDKAAEKILKPGVMILEAPMGQGKTEAALSAAEILMNRFKLNGIAFFLPSQATSNAMFSRMIQWAKQQPDALRVAVELAHGQAELNPDFRELQEGSVQVEQDEEESLIVHSFFRGRKTKLLSNLVVGTVDQLLMAALKQKHVMLRMLGLVGKVVIIDECHAYDAYMNTYLDRVLDWLGVLKVPVILLSATLPGKRRAELLNAYTGAGKRKADAIRQKTLDCENYPLLSYTGGEEPVHLEAVPYMGEHQAIRIERVGEEEALDSVGRVLEYGCAGVIVNTVRRAMEFYTKAKDLFPNAEILLCHSRFIAPDRMEHEQNILERIGKSSDEAKRKGVLVIGTQVLEQSLDLDFDLLVTDLCPMDLLLQRMGRLHRHKRIRPASLQEARCLVMGAMGKLDEGAKAVYAEYILLKSRDNLPEIITLPDDISPLVQATYAEDGSVDEKGGVYKAAKDKYEADCGNQMARADVYCLGIPARDGFENTIMGFMDTNEVFSEIQARAAVRDGNVSIEVLVVQMTEEGMVKVLSGSDRGREFRPDTQPCVEEAGIIATQRLRLPSYFSKSHRSDEVIDELEMQSKRLNLWRQAPMLEGELFLILDSDGRAELTGKKLKYNPQIGLVEEEE